MRSKNYNEVLLVFNLLDERSGRRDVHEGLLLVRDREVDEVVLSALAVVVHNPPHAVEQLHRREALYALRVAQRLVGLLRAVDRDEIYKALEALLSPLELWLELLTMTTPRREKHTHIRLVVSLQLLKLIYRNLVELQRYC